MNRTAPNGGCCIVDFRSVRTLEAGVQITNC